MAGKATRLEQEILVLRRELAKRGDREDTRKSPKGAGDVPKLGAVEAKKTVRSQQDQELYIAYLEDQIHRTRIKYQKKMNHVKSNANLLEIELQKVRQEMKCITVRAQNVDKLQRHVDDLKAKLKRRDMVIARYDAQHAEIMDMVRRLEEQSSSPTQTQEMEQETMTADNAPQADASSDHKEYEDSLGGISEHFNFSCLNRALRKKFWNKAEKSA
ncbi:uncharacterized protein LOC108598961 [Drosophila busckii]|uniref:uncharacterized protein LOC108598961 n=1 Tax=Drosophila busckii TaxID=30019 RepID=UPI00083EF40D|nr:uncharacterized protein LOC108598961 [Drosophila busckii]